LCYFNKSVDDGGNLGDTHPVASSEAVIYPAMRPASYRCIAMAIEIASELPPFLSSPISLSPTTVAK
jgi:hypothetical protein